MGLFSRNETPAPAASTTPAPCATCGGTGQVTDDKWVPPNAWSSTGYWSNLTLRCPACR